MIKKNPKHTERHMTANADINVRKGKHSFTVVDAASLEISVQNSFSVKTIKKSRRKYRDGSVFKNTYHSFRGLEFSSRGSSVLF